MKTFVWHRMCVYFTIILLFKLFSQIVEEALNKARNGRTSIVISHRLSSIIGANLIMYVDHGRCLEKGTHGELMNLKGHYYTLQQANQGHK